MKLEIIDEDEGRIVWKGEYSKVETTDDREKIKYYVKGLQNYLWILDHIKNQRGTGSNI